MVRIPSLSPWRHVEWAEEPTDEEFKSLSGDVRSFTLVSFILSLGSEISTPLLRDGRISCLASDEFLSCVRMLGCLMCSSVS
jgi:hypothetical protein